MTLVLGISITILAVEVAGGVLAHSIVLIADAAHMAVDAVGIGLSLLAVHFAARPPDDTRTFGYLRAEILAAVSNAVLLFGLGAFILADAAVRLVHPVKAAPSLMIVFGVVALAGNTASLVLLRHGHAEGLNVRAATLEALADLWGAGAVLVAAVVIAMTGFQRADAVAAIAIGALIVPRTAKLLHDSIDVLLEATPKNVDLTLVRGHICGTPGVLGVHDLHVWTVTSGLPVLSAHVVVDDAVLADGGAARVLDRLGECLAGHFDVDHCTFQLEPATHRAHEAAVHR